MSLSKSLSLPAAIPSSLSSVGKILLPLRMQVTLAADGVHLHKLDWRGRAEKAGEHLPLPAVSPDAPAWQAWVVTLANWLRVHAQRRVELRILLSDRFVRYQHLPWRDGIVHGRERQAYANHRFREVYGELAGQWQIALSSSTPGSASMACAMDRELLVALKSLGKQVRVVSAQPLFVAAYNRARRQCKGERFWFAHVESGRVCMALLKSGQSEAVRNEASNENWPQAIAAINRRLACADGVSEAPVPVYVCGDLQGVAAPQLLGNNPVHALSL